MNAPHYRWFCNTSLRGTTAAGAIVCMMVCWEKKRAAACLTRYSRIYLKLQTFSRARGTDSPPDYQTPSLSTPTLDTQTGDHQQVGKVRGEGTEHCCCLGCLLVSRTVFLKRVKQYVLYIFAFFFAPACHRCRCTCLTTFCVALLYRSRYMFVTTDDVMYFVAIEHLTLWYH